MLIIDYNIQDITEHVFDLILPLSPFFCRHYSKLMIRSPPILLSSTLEITTNSYSVELQKNDTILTPPPILYIHTPQVNNIESHVVLLELDTKFNILRYLLLRIKQPCYFAITDIQIDNIVGGVPVQLK